MEVGLGWRLGAAVPCGVCSGVVGAIASLAAVSPAWAAPGDTTLVSRASGIGGAKGNHWSLRPSISADGRFAAFQSAATNLARGAHGFQVYVRDLQAHTTRLVSRAGSPDGPRR